MRNIPAQGLRKSLPRVFESKARIAEQFFHALFRHAPEAEVFFHGEFGRQKIVLAKVIARIAQCADQPGALDRIAGRLVASHHSYDISREQYLAAAVALNEALHVNLSGRISEEELGYWTRVVDVLIGRMIDMSA